VNQRKREIGLRMALGATRAAICKLILREGMSLVLAGVLIGFAATLPIARLLSGMLYGIGASDSMSVSGAAIIMSAVALVARYLPARRASSVDPMIALRES